MKSGFVAILGRPNVGKSTLANVIAGEKIAIVSHKPQTTRSRICAICLRGDAQLVFLDTPGYHKPKNALDSYLDRIVETSVADNMDAVVLMVEPIANVGKQEQALIKMIRSSGSPAVLAINKCDTVNKPDLLAVISARVTYFNPEISASRLSVLIPVFILAVPIFDTFAVVVIRLLNHKPIYVGDHNHISHRFHHMGMTRKRAVLLVHLLCLIAGLGALPLLWGDERVCFILLAQGAAILLLLTSLQYSGNLNNDQQNNNHTTGG